MKLSIEISDVALIWLSIVAILLYMVYHDKHSNTLAGIADSLDDAEDDFSGLSFGLRNYAEMIRARS